MFSPQRRQSLSTPMADMLCCGWYVKLRFGHKAKLWFRLRAQGLVKIWSWNSGEILKLKFGQYFAADVEVTKLNLGQDSEVRFGQDFKFKFSRDADVWLKLLMLNWDSEIEIWSRFVYELVIWTQPSGPLCLWQWFESVPYTSSHHRDKEDIVTQ